MTCDALQFRHHAAEDRAAVRHSDPQRQFDRTGESKAVGHRRVTADARYDASGGLDIGTAQQRIDAIARLAESRFHPHDRGRRATSNGMPPVGQSCIGGPKVEGAQSVALDAIKGIVAWVAQQAGNIRTQRRADAPGPVVEPRPVVRHIP